MVVDHEVLLAYIVLSFVSPSNICDMLVTLLVLNVLKLIDEADATPANIYDISVTLLVLNELVSINEADTAPSNICDISVALLVLSEARSIDVTLLNVPLAVVPNALLKFSPTINLSSR